MLNSLLHLFATKPATRPTAKTRLTVEEFESRLVPTVSLANGVLLVDGTANADTCVVSQVSNMNGTFYQVTLNGQSQLFAKAAVTTNSMVFQGFAGDDYLSCSGTDLRLTAYMGDGNDYVLAGNGNDYIDAGAGNDSVSGNGGNDTILGQAGNDYLDGGQGNDSIFGGRGEDWVLGGDGNDYLDGGHDGQHDHLWGGQGADTFVKDVVWFNNLQINLDAGADFDMGQGDHYQ